MWRNKNTGFTLIEVVVAVVITGIVIASVFSLIQGTVADHHFAASQLQAAYLAQQAIEEVRNQRDINWLTGNPWNTLSASSPSVTIGNTVFSRSTTIDTSVADEAKITVTVTWAEGGRPGELTVVTKLYNWYE